MFPKSKSVDTTCGHMSLSPNEEDDDEDDERQPPPPPPPPPRPVLHRNHHDKNTVTPTTYQCMTRHIAGELKLVELAQPGMGKQFAKQYE